MNTHDRYDLGLTGAVWCKATYSNGNGGDCVEVADLDGGIRAVRAARTPQAQP